MDDLDIILESDELAYHEWREGIDDALLADQREADWQAFQAACDADWRL